MPLGKALRHELSAGRGTKMQKKFKEEDERARESSRGLRVFFLSFSLFFIFNLKEKRGSETGR